MYCTQAGNCWPGRRVWPGMPFLRLLLLLLALCPLLKLQALAAELKLRPGRYHSAERWDYLPDSRWLAADWRTLLPDLEPQALGQLSYQEQSLNGTYNLAAVGLPGRPNCQLSLIYYSPGGYAYLMRRALPLPRSGQLYAALEVPADESRGLLRTLLWSQQPDFEALSRMMRQPLDLSTPVHGLIGQRWLERQRPGAAHAPWQDPDAAVTAPPLGFDPRSWPACFARLDSSGQVALKDCVLNSTGRAVADPDDYRAYAWELHWGDELVLSFALPHDLEPRRAELRLDFVTVGAGSGSGGLGREELSIEVNGWDTSQLDSNRAFGHLLQPAGLEVSHYLRSGVNQIRLRAPALAGQSWLIRRIELWID